MKLSALVLVKNEGEMLEDCLNQLTFVDEIIVLDQNSQDESLQIAQKLATHVISSGSTEFDLNRNLLKNKASGEWLLYIDADERISESLKTEIKVATSKYQFAAYYIPRKNFILGKWLKHGGWWPDYVPKLFKKDKLVKWSGELHESPQINGDFGYLASPILHYTARDIFSMLAKTIKWAKTEAILFKQADAKPVTSLKVVKVTLVEFMERYLVKKGFLDGSIGFIQAGFQAVHKAIVLVYLWEIQHNSEQKGKN